MLKKISQMKGSILWQQFGKDQSTKQAHKYDCHMFSDYGFVVDILSSDLGTTCVATLLSLLPVLLSVYLRVH